MAPNCLSNGNDSGDNTTSNRCSTCNDGFALMGSTTTAYCLEMVHECSAVDASGDCNECNANHYLF